VPHRTLPQSLAEEKESPALSGRAQVADRLCILPPADLGSLSDELWIEVSLREQVVRLCKGNRMLSEYIAATGAGDDPETMTWPGLFEVYEKDKGPIYLPQYDVFVSDWVGFDPEHNNGFHSLPMDENGRILDGRLGWPVSHGCVRTAQSAEVFDWAQIGTKVWVH